MRAVGALGQWSPFLNYKLILGCHTALDIQRINFFLVRTPYGQKIIPTQLS